MTKCAIEFLKKISKSSEISVWEKIYFFLQKHEHQLINFEIPWGKSLITKNIHWMQQRSYQNDILSQYAEVTLIYINIHLIKKNGVCLRSHGRSENYEVTWWTGFKISRRFCSRNLLKRSFAIALFCSALFSLTCLFWISLVGSSCIEEFSALLLTIFLYTRISQFPFFFNLSLIWFFHPSCVTKDN